MFRFKQFISEGGAFQLGPIVDRKRTGPKAAPFESSLRGETIPVVTNFLSSLSDEVKKQHGVEIFGQNKQALHNREAFKTGSTEYFMDPKIPHQKYTAGIKKTGDVDALIDGRHKEKVEQTLNSLTGKNVGGVKFVGWGKGADESHILLQHPMHPHPLQIDLNHVEYENHNPTRGAQFARSGGSFEDRSRGIKGSHHKMLLSLVAKAKNLRWGPRGLKERDAEPSAEGDKTPESVSTKLYGAAHEGIHSFTGNVGLIANHIPKEHHQEIVDGFRHSLEKEKESNPEQHPAMIALKRGLDIA